MNLLHQILIKKISLNNYLSLLDSRESHRKIAMLQVVCFD